MESRQENIAQPEKKSKHASWRSIVGGDILATDFFRRQTKLLVLVMVLILLHPQPLRLPAADDRD